MKKTFNLFAAVLLLVGLVGCMPKKDVRPELLEGPGWTRVDNNLHQIDGPPPGEGPAYRLYRSGAPSKETFAKWCGEFQIERSIVLAGDADSHELAYEAEGVCPGFSVVYNETQDPAKPVTAEFLEFFDDQIAKAKADNVGVLLRCQTGSHRAGRLSAYYQMKYQGLTADEAIAVMDYNGMLMPLFDPFLRPQVRAMEDYIKGRPCSQQEKFCVVGGN